MVFFVLAPPALFLLAPLRRSVPLSVHPREKSVPHPPPRDMKGWAHTPSPRLPREESTGLWIRLFQSVSALGGAVRVVPQGTRQLHVPFLASSG